MSTREEKNCTYDDNSWELWAKARAGKPMPDLDLLSGVNIRTYLGAWAADFGFT